MNWATLQQLIRIFTYAIGSAVFGADVADGELFEGALSGLVAIGAFVWWIVAERSKGKIR